MKILGTLFSLLVASFAAGQNFTEFQFSTLYGSHGMTAGPDGNIWFTEYRVPGNRIARITPEGVIPEFAIPTEFAHPLGITTGPDGNLWFTENRGLNQIGRITTSGEIREFPIREGTVNPIGITTGPDGALWFAELSGNTIGASPRPARSPGSFFPLARDRSESR